LNRPRRSTTSASTTRPTTSSWQPEFGYKGFRYVEVDVVGEVGVDEILAIPYISEIEARGSFRCDEPVLDWLPNAVASTLRNNLHGIPTDTPVYEKNGWTADAHLVAESALFHLDMRPLLTKWLDDHVDAQDDTGVVPQIIPTPGWGRRLDPAWSGSMVLLPWNLYWESGDVGILRRYVEPMRRYLDRTLAIAADAGWIWPLHSWGDWVAPGGPASEGPAPVNTMIVAHLADRFAQTLRLLGDNAGAQAYTACLRRGASG
jgi:alpha-L-rhamnosidase